MNRQIFYLLIALLPFLGSCKKIVEKINDAQEQAAVDVVTNGRWKMVAFSTGTTDQLPLFNNYLFQFNTNQTVDAYQGNTMVMSGTFVYDLNARTITSGFPTSSEPLSLLNGTFRVTDSGADFVKAEMTVNGETRRLHMIKP
ncbi:hypothetical protein EPD60_10830 [Flaviaesturariibacter flavus]|uniref:Lipocalin-like domain-containing protein n=1 Tax=Flaviaesturariibacter flavus TaxID=2502780 RepID=A0A4R1BBV7_9BACT|nr:hypothetical protein [Flaviaesturariibacter flavus]TCJ14474.1 hypothetical protein EPD60_10830 [Flaviaesturariibacter flavus]